MKKLLLPILAIVFLASCAPSDDKPHPVPPPSNNLGYVIREFPNAVVYSEKDNPDGQEWIIMLDGKLYDVYVSNSRVDRATLLSPRYNPANFASPKDLEKQNIQSRIIDTVVKADTNPTAIIINK